MPAIKLQTFAALLAFVSVTTASSFNVRNVHHNNIHKRQTTSTSSSGSASATTGTSAASGASSGTTSLTSAASAATGLEGLTSGRPSGTTYPLTATYSQGATPSYSNAPALPSPSFVFQMGVWPAQDKVPETNSPEVSQWMADIAGFSIPDLEPTADGYCGSSPELAAKAAERGWWTCGGYTRATDIVTCPDKLTWGVSFDDGPGPYTTKLLKYLDEKSILATFFVVGSRVIERPQVLIEEYMKGHEISVHTWSHRSLTSLTNEQIVAELGWTKKAIKAVLGVTPTTMRPPYGDIDDRVRAIALAMGLTPIIWTATPSGAKFDTNDWQVAGGNVKGVDSFHTFENILNNASTLDTGFIVLAHDLYEITVELATNYTLNAALTHNPPFTLKPIGSCAKIPTSDLYAESNTNKSFPYANTSSAQGAGNASGDNGALSTVSMPFGNLLGLAVLALFGGAML